MQMVFWLWLIGFLGLGYDIYRVECAVREVTPEMKELLNTHELAKIHEELETFGYQIKEGLKTIHEELETSRDQITEGLKEITKAVNRSGGVAQEVITGGLKEIEKAVNRLGEQGSRK